MSLLPMALFSCSITVPGKGKNLSYETLAKFCSVELPAERDGFASNADKLGSKALSDLLQKGLTPDAQVKIEEDYNKFFDTIRDEQNSWKELPPNKANGNQKSLGHLKGAKTTAR